MVSPAFGQGMDAHAGGLSVLSNPYHPVKEHLDHQDWVAGWHQQRINTKWD